MPCIYVDWSGGWTTTWGSAIVERLIGHPQEALLCAKAKRQRQMFSVRKRSVSDKCFLCESEASATNVFCAKAKRQQQMFSVRKRSGSNKCFLCESEASATNVLSARKRSVSGKAPSCNGNHPFVIAQTLSCQYLIDGDICFIYNHFSS